MYRFSALLLLIATAALFAAPIAAQPPGRWPTNKVEQFDRDGNGRIEGAERIAALEFLKAQHDKNPPRRRGRKPPETDLKPRKISRSSVKSHADRGLYDLDVIHTIFLDFTNPDWDADMQLFWKTGIDERATLMMNGQNYPDVGVHFRGSSSFFSVRNRPKKSMSISLDYVHANQNLKGFRAINLLSAHADPSFIRTVLFSKIAGQYIPVPKACFVHLVINGESWGLYINDQQINREFLAAAFKTKKKGARWKVGPNFSGQSALAYQGPKVKDYSSKYQLKSAKSEKKAWKALIKLCKTLSEASPEELTKELPAQLDIEHTLWYLALDNVLMDGDGYHYRGSDYALYRHPDGRFYPLARDNNEAFRYGGGPGGFGREGQRRSRKGEKLAPLALAREERAALCDALFSVPRWRATYLDHCREVRDRWLVWDRVGPVIEELRARIEPFVAKDDKALYGYEAFQTAFGDGGKSKPGLRAFIDARFEYLRDHEDLKKD